MNRLRLLAMGVVTGVVTLAAALPVAAATTSGVAQSYQTDGSVRQGMIVALSPTNTNEVVALTSHTVQNMLGVAIAPSAAPITLSGGSGQQMYVATSGQYSVLVSSENGQIRAGDYISVSSLDGIGMKAADTETTVLGRAAADFTQANVVARHVSVRTSSGTTYVEIGSIPVSIVVGTNPDVVAGGGGNLPGFLQTASSAIAARPVATARIYLALAVLALSGFIAASVLYSGIRGGVQAIGRNPLARRAIVGGVLQAVAVGAGVFVLGLVAVYLLLRL